MGGEKGGGGGGLHPFLNGMATGQGREDGGSVARWRSVTRGERDGGSSDWWAASRPTAAQSQRARAARRCPNKGASGPLMHGP
jgi:hypothetical protein